jgi:parallel beta-helix repeat protein
MGIEIVWSPSNRIYENSIEGNGDGIWVSQSDNNVIFHNNFINNTHHAYEYPYTTKPSFNEWDNGYPHGGNYWSDYNGTDLYSGQHQNVTGSDGIGDIPYVTFTNNTDNYPLMNPYTDDPILLMAMENLQKQINALRDEVTAVRDALNSTERLLYVSLITTIIFIATTIYFARDKWKKRLKSRADATKVFVVPL